MSSSFLVLAVLVARVLAVFDIDSTPNAVGICYSVWHSLGFTGAAPPDITEIENGNGSFAGQGAWHFWGRPDGGYYGGGDRGVLDRHFSQITGAGIDFIVIDATNLQVRRNCDALSWTRLTFDVGIWELCRRPLHGAYGCAP